MTQTALTAESELLAAYATQRSAEAFAELVHRYAGLVYAVGWRITRNRADAEDVAQESFLQLAANADQIVQPLGAWLHAVARSRAVDLIRRRQARVRYEKQQAADASPTIALDQWERICHQVDEAIAQLPDELRVPLIGQYFQSQTQAELANSMGVSQGTVSRRIERAIEVLREQLHQAGVDVPSVAVLGTLLADHGTIAAPAQLVEMLAKIGLAGVRQATTPMVTAAGIGKVAAGLAALLIIGISVIGLVLMAQTNLSSGGGKSNRSSAGAPATQVSLDGELFPAAANIDALHPRDADTSPYPQGLSIILQQLGHDDATYTRIMGYSGMAFVTLMDLRGPITDGEYDMAWWPNDSIPFELRMTFLERAFGRQLLKVDDVNDLHATDPKRLYQERFEPIIMRAIVAGRPVLATNDAAFVISGYDQRSAEVKGLWPSPGQPFYEAKTLYPWGIIVPGEAIPPVSQSEAEIESLKWAIALGEDTAVASVQETAPLPWLDRKPRNQWSSLLLTGQKSYAQWIAWLKGNDKLGARAWDANMVVHLRYNREAAVAYLRDVANHHGDDAAMHIRAAADLYQQVLDLLRDIPMSWQFPDSAEHKQQYTQTIERVASLEAQAVSELRLAVAVMPTTAPAK